MVSDMFHTNWLAVSYILTLSGAAWTYYAPGPITVYKHKLPRINLYCRKYKNKFNSFLKYVFFSDVDECKEGIHKCTDEQECQNIKGSYQCVQRCRDGYQEVNGQCVGK